MIWGGPLAGVDFVFLDPLWHFRQGLLDTLVMLRSGLTKEAYETVTSWRAPWVFLLRRRRETPASKFSSHLVIDLLSIPGFSALECRFS